MITETQIKAAMRNVLTSGKTSAELKDGGERGGGRLALIIRPLPGRIAAEWYAVYYRHGRRRMAKIGSYPTMSLADARKKFREEYAPAISAGTDPTSAYAQRRARSANVTVTELFTAYIDSLERAGKRSAREAKRHLLSPTTGAARVIGADRPAREITSDDIVTHLAEIHDRGSVVMASKARSYLSSAFAFGLKAAHDYTRKTAVGADWGLLVNPVAGIPADPAAHRKVDRFLSPSEFRAFWLWLVSYDRKSAIARACRLIMATGQRIEEILRITDAGYDRAAKTIFWDDTKNGRSHMIPLPSAAIEILDGIPANRKGMFFPNKRHPDQHAHYTSVEFVISKYLEATKATHFTPRDLRRTWKTLAGKAGISKDMRDRLQNHSKGDVSSRHYDRYDYLEEKRQAMKLWSAYLDKLLAGETEQGAPSNVVPLIAPAAA